MFLLLMKIHLENMFVETGDSKKDAVFLNDFQTNMHHRVEASLVGMIADISRIRSGDKVIFYVIGCGKFYGVFKIM